MMRTRAQHSLPMLPRVPSPKPYVAWRYAVPTPPSLLRRRDKRKTYENERRAMEAETVLKRLVGKRLEPWQSRIVPGSALRSLLPRYEPCMDPLSKSFQTQAARKGNHCRKMRCPVCSVGTVSATRVRLAGDLHPYRQHLQLSPRARLRCLFCQAPLPAHGSLERERQPQLPLEQLQQEETMTELDTSGAQGNAAEGAWSKRAREPFVEPLWSSLEDISDLFCARQMPLSQTPHPRRAQEINAGLQARLSTRPNCKRTSSAARARQLHTIQGPARAARPGSTERKNPTRETPNHMADYWEEEILRTIFITDEEGNQSKLVDFKKSLPVEKSASSTLREDVATVTTEAPKEATAPESAERIQRYDGNVSVMYLTHFDLSKTQPKLSSESSYSLKLGRGFLQNDNEQESRPGSASMPNLAKDATKISDSSHTPLRPQTRETSSALKKRALVNQPKRVPSRSEAIVFVPKKDKLSQRADRRRRPTKGKSLGSRQSKRNTRSQTYLRTFAAESGKAGRDVAKVDRCPSRSDSTLSWVSEAWSVGTNSEGMLVHEDRAASRQRSRASSRQHATSARRRRRRRPRRKRRGQRLLDSSDTLSDADEKTLMSELTDEIRRMRSRSSSRMSHPLSKLEFPYFYRKDEAPQGFRVGSGQTGRFKEGRALSSSRREMSRGLSRVSSRQGKDSSARQATPVSATNLSLTRTPKERVSEWLKKTLKQRKIKRRKQLPADKTASVGGGTNSRENVDSNKSPSLLDSIRTLVAPSVKYGTARLHRPNESPIDAQRRLKKTSKPTEQSLSRLFTPKASASNVRRKSVTISLPDFTKSRSKESAAMKQTKDKSFKSSTGKSLLKKRLQRNTQNVTRTASSTQTEKPGTSNGRIPQAAGDLPPSRKSSACSCPSNVQLNSRKKSAQDLAHFGLSRNKDTVADQYKETVAYSLQNLMLAVEKQSDRTPQEQLGKGHPLSASSSALSLGSAVCVETDSRSDLSPGSPMSLSSTANLTRVPTGSASLTESHPVSSALDGVMRSESCMTNLRSHCSTSPAHAFSLATVSSELDELLCTPFQRSCIDMYLSRNFPDGRPSPVPPSNSPTEIDEVQTWDEALDTLGTTEDETVAQEIQTDPTTEETASVTLCGNRKNEVIADQTKAERSSGSWGTEDLQPSVKKVSLRDRDRGSTTTTSAASRDESEMKTLLPIGDTATSPVKMSELLESSQFGPDTEWMKEEDVAFMRLLCDAKQTFSLPKKNDVTTGKRSAEKSGKVNAPDLAATGRQLSLADHRHAKSVKGTGETPAYKRFPHNITPLTKSTSEKTWAADQDRKSAMPGKAATAEDLARTEADGKDLGFKQPPQESAQPPFPRNHLVGDQALVQTEDEKSRNTPLADRIPMSVRREELMTNVAELKRLKSKRRAKRNQNIRFLKGDGSCRDAIPFDPNTGGYRSTPFFCEVTNNADESKSVEGMLSSTSFHSRAKSRQSTYSGPHQKSPRLSAGESILSMNHMPSYSSPSPRLRESRNHQNSCSGKVTFRGLTPEAQASGSIPTYGEQLATPDPSSAMNQGQAVSPTEANGEYLSSERMGKPLRFPPHVDFFLLSKKATLINKKEEIEKIQKIRCPNTKPHIKSVSLNSK